MNTLILKKNMYWGSHKLPLCLSENCVCWQILWSMFFLKIINKMPLQSIFSLKIIILFINYHRLPCSWSWYARLTLAHKQYILICLKNEMMILSWELFLKDLDTYFCSKKGRRIIFKSTSRDFYHSNFDSLYP